MIGWIKKLFGIRDDARMNAYNHPPKRKGPPVPDDEPPAKTMDQIMASRSLQAIAKDCAWDDQARREYEAATKSTTWDRTADQRLVDANRAKYMIQYPDSASNYQLAKELLEKAGDGQGVMVPQNLDLKPLQKAIKKMNTGKAMNDAIRGMGQKIGQDMLKARRNPFRIDPGDRILVGSSKDPIEITHINIHFDDPIRVTIEGNPVKGES